MNFPPNNALLMKSRKLISAGYVVRMHSLIVFNDALSSSHYTVSNGRVMIIIIYLYDNNNNNNNKLQMGRHPVAVVILHMHGL
jgi:hypothetical protein